MTIDIATERTARGLKQSDLADLAGVHVRTLRRLEKGGEGVSDVMRERVLIALGLLRDSEASDREKTPKLLRPDPTEYETALSVVDAEARRSDVSDFFSPFMILGLTPIVLVGGLAVTSRFGGPAGLVSFAVGAAGIVTFVLFGLYLLDRRLLRVQDECRTVLRGISVGAVTAIDSKSMWLVRCNSSKANLQAARDSSACSVVVLESRP